MSPVTFSLLSPQKAKSLSWGTLLGAVLLGCQQCRGRCWKDPAPLGAVVALPLTGLWGWCPSGSLTACVFSWGGEHLDQQCMHLSPASGLITTFPRFPLLHSFFSCLLCPLP